MAGELAAGILSVLQHAEKVTSLDLADKLKQDHQKVVGAIKSIEAIGDVSQTSYSFMLIFS